MANEIMQLVEPGRRVSIYHECNLASKRDLLFAGAEKLLAAGFDDWFVGVLPDDEGANTIGEFYRRFPEAYVAVMYKPNQAIGPKLVTNLASDEQWEKLADLISSAEAPPVAIGLDLEQVWRDLVWSENAAPWKWNDFRSAIANAFDPIDEETIRYIYPALPSAPARQPVARDLVMAWASVADPFIDNVSVNGPGAADNPHAQAAGDQLAQLGLRAVGLAYCTRDYYPCTRDGFTAAVRTGFKRYNHIIINPGEANLLALGEALK